jgi:hypothetical protein
LSGQSQWGDASIWGLGRVPCPSDFVSIGVQSAAPVVVNVTQTVFVRSLDLAPGSEINIMPNTAINILTVDEAASATNYLTSQNFTVCNTPGETFFSNRSVAFKI